MLRNKLVRSDGSIIDSSVIISCEYTEEVNSSENLSVGDVTSSEINLEMLSTDMVEQGEVLTYYIIEDGVEERIGVFNAERPTVASRTSVKFSAFDNIVKSEKIFSDWLRENQALFPMTLLELVTYACTYCGLTLATTDLPQSTLAVKAFYADGITCRQILSWAAAIAGRFVRANSAGAIEFAWYADTSSITIAPAASSGTVALEVADDGKGNVTIEGENAAVTDDGEGNVSVEIPSVTAIARDGAVSLVSAAALPYKQRGLTYEAYSTDLIERVQIKQSDDDMGVIYPDSASGNCFTISGNMILGTCTQEVISSVAESLYQQLSTISYVPAKVSLFRTGAIRAGDIISVVVPNGNVFTTYVMKVVISPSGTRVESTGDKSYDTSAAVASEKFSNLTGKILGLKKSIDGLEIRNEDLAGKIGSLELNTEEFKTHVVGTYVSEDEFGDYKTTVSTQFQQTAESFEMKFQSNSTAISDVNKDLREKYDERVSYIRFEDGTIILGRSDSDILLIQRNNRISFVRNVKDLPEVAWFANDVLHVTQGEFLSELRVGKFAFTPGVGGNLSFKKVVT
jgi:hypothetical protein